MHRVSVGRMASAVAMLSGMFAGMGKEMSRAAEAADGMADAMSAVAPIKGLSRHPHPKSHTAFLNQESRRPSPDYIARQKMRVRWENGLPVPKDVAAAYERHQAERADIARRRSLYDQHPSVRARFATV